MSQENVEIVRRGFGAFSEGGIEASLEFFTEDLVLHSMPEWPDDAEYHGHDGLRKLARQWEENFDDFGFRVVDVRDGGDSVVALLEMAGSTKEAGVPLAAEIGAVSSQFEDGRAGDVRYFGSWKDALESAGLPAD